MEHHISKSEHRKSAVGMLGIAVAVDVVALIVFLLSATPVTLALVKLLGIAAACALMRSLAYFTAAYFTKE